MIDQPVTRRELIDLLEKAEKESTRLPGQNVIYTLCRLAREEWPEAVSSANGEH